MSFFHAVSGARSAAMAAATAAVTSIPGVLTPDSEASMLLRLTALLVLVAVDDNSELIEEVELIASTFFREGAGRWSRVG
jgi:hypothetical protein